MYDRGENYWLSRPEEDDYSEDSGPEIDRRIDPLRQPYYAALWTSMSNDGAVEVVRGWFVEDDEDDEEVA